MNVLRRILGLESTPTRAADEAPTPDEGPGITVRDLVRQLMAPEPAARSEAALLLSALVPPEALQPLVRCYVDHGDEAVAEALGSYGDRVTPVAAREARDLSRAGSQRARALDLLRRIGDPAARAALRAVVVDPDPTVHIAAAVALVEVGDEAGKTFLSAGLEARPTAWRAAALRALREAENPAAEAIAADHVVRYLAEGGAVPEGVAVAMPVLLDLGSDLAHLLGGHVRAARAPLVLLTGPGTADLAETQRETLRPYLASRRLFFTTARHDAPEQVEVLLAARAASVEHPGGAVLVGPLPDPDGVRHLPDFLGRWLRRRDGALIVYVGPQSHDIARAWWRYVGERAVVPAELVFVLTNLAIGGERLGPEAWEVYQRCQDGRAAEFARAYLAHLPEPG